MHAQSVEDAAAVSAVASSTDPRLPTTNSNSKRAGARALHEDACPGVLVGLGELSDFAPGRSQRPVRCAKRRFAEPHQFPRRRLARQNALLR